MVRTRQTARKQAAGDTPEDAEKVAPWHPIMPRLDFQRLVHEIVLSLQTMLQTDVDVPPTTIDRMQEATEAYLVSLFENANKWAKRAKRDAITPEDILRAAYGNGA